MTNHCLLCLHTSPLVQMSRKVLLEFQYMKLSGQNLQNLWLFQLFPVDEPKNATNFLITTLIQVLTQLYLSVVNVFVRKIKINTFSNPVISTSSMQFHSIQVHCFTYCYIYNTAFPLPDIICVL